MALAAGVVPSTVDMPYYPGEKHIISYQVSGYNDIELEMSCPFVKLNGEIIKTGSNHKFTVSVDLPEEIDAEPGRLNCGFMIKEKTTPDMPVGLGAFVEVGTNIYVHIPYEGRYAKLKLNVDNVKKGEPAYFKLSISNQGEEALKDLLPIIEVSDLEGNIKQVLHTDSVSVPIFEERVVWKKMETTDFEPARYNALATLNYMGDEPAVDETDFLIGKLFVDFVEMTPNVTVGKISPVEVEVQSWWGDLIKNVHAHVELMNGSQTLTSFKTVSADLDPWQTVKLDGYLDVTEIPAGTYDAKINLYYDDAESLSETTIDVLPVVIETSFWDSAKGFLTGPTLLIIILILLFAINILTWYWKKRSSKNEKG